MQHTPFFTSTHCPQLHVDPVPATQKQLGVQYKALQMLIEEGSITAWDVQNLGTTDARKLCYRLKQKGYISKVEMEPNADGSGKHARYIWSGKK